ncbi:MAG: zinc-binding dehydrogenase, partial [Gammaproteobacteria bacterium]|nr:zinc-binding dehydrogenase [Gammaproteobacteria bacterium]
EFMFTRPMFNTDDLIAQHQVLQRIADLLDEGKLVTTLTETVGPMTADNITKAHHQIGLGTTIGKLALTAIM